MSFINMLRAPFYYDDADKLSIKESITSIVISLVITVFIMIIENGVIGAGVKNNGFEMNLTVPFSMYFTIVYATLIGFLLGTCALVGIVYLINVINKQEINFERSLSIVSNSIVLPTVLLSGMLIGGLMTKAMEDSNVLQIIGLVIQIIFILVSVLILAVNIYKSISIISKKHNGLVSYGATLGTVLYYVISIYVTEKIVIEALMKTFFNGLLH